MIAWQTISAQSAPVPDSSLTTTITTTTIGFPILITKALSPPEPILDENGQITTVSETVVTSGISQCDYHCDFVTENSLWGASSSHWGLEDAGKTVTRDFIDGQTNLIPLTYVIATSPTPIKTFSLGDAAQTMFEAVTTVVHVDGTVTDTLVVVDDFFDGGAATTDAPVAT